MSENPDAIVIGAGHNGLTCGIMLAKEGWDVLVLEQASRPGGACKTAEVTKPGFKHDLYATNVGLFLGSPVYEQLGEELHEHGLELAVSDQPYASVFPDGDGLAVYNDSEKTHHSFANFSESDAESWNDLLDYFDRVSPYLFPFLSMPVPSLKAAKQLYHTARGLGMDGTMELASQLLKSPREFTEYWFEHEKVRSLFIPWAFHLDYAPDVSGGAMFPFLETIMDFREGMPLVRGGVGGLTESLVALLKSEGGKLELNQSVERVVVEDSQAMGVVLESGEQLRASKAVIGNLTPTQLFERLVDSSHLESSFMKSVRNYRYGPGTVMIHCALNEPLEWKAGAEFSDSTYVHICPYVDDVARTYQQVMAGKLPDSPMLVVGQPTSVDPDRAPDDKHVLWIQVRAVPPQIQDDAAGKISASSWERAIQPFEQRVFDKLEQYAPGIREKMLDFTTLGPGDLESDNPNLVGGDSLAGSHHLDQHWGFRPFPNTSNYRTPIENLYMCGASTWPGGGLNATSGYLLARQLTTSTLSRTWNALTA